MLKICTNCYHIGVGIHEEKCSWFVGLFCIFIGLAIPFIFVSILPIFILLLATAAPLSIILGMKFILPCYKKEGGLCAKCKKSNFLIPIDSPKAQALIKEHNITIPEEPVEPLAESPKPKAPWQVD